MNASLEALRALKRKGAAAGVAEALEVIENLAVDFLEQLDAARRRIAVLERQVSEIRIDLRRKGHRL